MNYVQGFVTPVPTANLEKYLEQATKAVPFFRQFGVRRVVEVWGDDVPKGKVTDFHGALKAGDHETVVFSWMEYPDKKMPFDGQRMFWGGFTPIVDRGR